jgi:hypothetical protein
MSRRDLIAGFFWFFISVFIIFKAFEMDVGSFSAPGPGFVLCGASLLLLILSIVLAIKGMLVKQNQTPDTVRRPLASRMMAPITIAALVLYALLLRSAGFVLATFGFMTLLYLMGKYKPWTAILSALLTVVLSYALFHFVLQVPFPRGPFTW